MITKSKTKAVNMATLETQHTAAVRQIVAGLEQLHAGVIAEEAARAKCREECGEERGTLRLGPGIYDQPRPEELPLKRRPARCIAKLIARLQSEFSHIGWGADS